MVKQRSSKGSQGSKEGSVVAEEKKPSSAAKKSNDEIDEIFASKKRTKADQVKANKRGDALSAGPKKMKKNKKDRGDNNATASEWASRPRKRTGDGLAIYTQDELGINKADAGGTPLCPFDCSCCF